MKRNVLLSAAIAAVLLAGCESGDIVLAPTGGDVINPGNGGGGGGGTTNPCALYVDSGQTFQGAFDANGNCNYGVGFVSDVKPILVPSITFSNFGGLHIFADSLFIGEDVNANAAAAGKRVPQEGEGTRLNIEPGVTMVFTAPDSYLRIARGSQIIAEGTADAPITFTGNEDAVLGIATESDRGLWGGIQINGNGRTNKCHDGTVTGRNGVAGNSDFEPTANNPHNCHVTAEGRPSTYGGNNNAESSGILKYVVVKHAGFEVTDGDELNAITFNGVGYGTTVSYVQTYTSQDDGFEMFGGAVHLDHVVGVNVGDDTYDFSEGWVGDIQYAVAIHTSGANTCVEADNTGQQIPDGITPLTKGRISNLTCVVTGTARNQGNNPSAKGDSEGLLFREGTYFEIYNSIVTSNHPDMFSHECFELDDTEGPESIDAAQRNNDPNAAPGTEFDASYASSNVIACSEALKAGVDAANTGFDLGVWLQGGDGSAETPLNNNTNNVVLTGADIPASSLIEGGTGTRGYRTAELILDGSGAVVFDQATDLFDVSTLPDGAIPGFFSEPTYLGGATADDDWLAGWTVGLDAALVP